MSYICKVKLVELSQRNMYPHFPHKNIHFRTGHRGSSRTCLLYQPSHHNAGPEAVISHSTLSNNAYTGPQPHPIMKKNQLTLFPSSNGYAKLIWLIRLVLELCQGQSVIVLAEAVLVFCNIISRYKVIHESWIVSQEHGIPL